MTRQALAGFIAINIIVSVAVVMMIILLWDATHEQDPIIVTRVHSTVVTATGQRLDVVTMVVLISATPGAPVADSGGQGPATEVPTFTTFDSTSEGVPTLDPEILGNVTLPPSAGGSGGDGDSVSTGAPDDGCQRYVVVSGDTCGSIAERFEVDTGTLISLNDIDAACQSLQVGQELRIPGPSCQPPPTFTLTPTITSTPFTLGTFVVTNTPAPTATDADVQIVQLFNFGDVTLEVVEIQNQGEEVVALGGWTLSDIEGNIYTFPDIRIQPNTIIRIFTRVGQNTPGALYWNETVPVWEVGDVATLSDGAGAIQSMFEVESETIDFSGEDTDE